MSAKAKPEYPRKRVNWAGEVLVQGEAASIGDHILALEIISNWRASHSHPLLSARMSLAGRAKSVDGAALIAQRLKRLPSIESKLRRNPTMKLSQMQDIGGCRAVVRNIDALKSLYAMYGKSIENRETDRPQCCEVYDYITTPKRDGYRGLHLVYKYGSRRPHLNDIYGGMRVEIQLRSRLQHVWATAVEIVGAFTHQALKSGIGSDNWKRFFALMSNAIALRERAPRVPGTPSRKNPLVTELRALNKSLGVTKALHSMKAVVDYGSKEEQGAKMFLLELDTATGVVKVWSFKADEEAIANFRYLMIEKSIANEPSKQAVLVSVDSLTSLPDAYPNYYADTTAFLEAVRHAIS